MRMPSASARRLLEKATANYQTDLILADSYLNGRGIGLATANEWRLGVVSSPEPGHETYTGRLCIPYQNKLGVIGLKFRCIAGHDCKAAGCTKYLCPDGQERYLFNVADVDKAAPVLHITEGELDAIVLAEAFGEPVVGWPGTGVWQPHWPYHCQGFERVIGWPDGDKAGKDWAAKLRKEIPAFEAVNMPSGKDVNDLYLEAGTEALKALAGVEEPEVTHV